MDQVTMEAKADIFDKLNPEQLEAVKHTEGPLLVLAGAGTGKTRVLTTRIAHILLQKKAFPGEILAVTFTNKAAREIMERVDKITAAQGIWIGTFHSIAARILRRHAELLGLTSSFIILDSDDQLKLVKQVLQDLNHDIKTYVPKYIHYIIERWKDDGLKPQDLSSNDMSSQAHFIAKQVYAIYEVRLIQNNSVDFGELLLANLKLFNNNPEILEYYQGLFKYVLVDEYQDTNIAQYLWLRLLAQKHKNICCVGDDDQSIYGWRGAKVGNILRFEKEFTGAKLIRLERNYRSTAYILGAASSVIANNESRLGKTLFTEGAKGSKVKITKYYNDREEAVNTVREIERLGFREKMPFSNMAILVRAGFQTRVFEEAFITYGVPYKVVGGFRFYERMEIRDCLSYLRLVNETNDSLAFERIVNVPKRGIGDTSVKNIRIYAMDHEISMFEAAKRLIDEPSFKMRGKKELAQFVTNITRWREMLRSPDIDTMQAPNFATIAELVIKESGYLDMWRAEKTEEGKERVENIKELQKVLYEYDSLQEFLEHVSLVTALDQMNQDEMATIMTLHAAKGLEFDTVFLPGWEEGIFPSSKSLEENGKAGLEEERRLAYVGITRAKRRLYISSARTRMIYNQWQESIISRFIKEIDPEFTESFE